MYGAFSGTAQGTVFTMAANLPFEYMGMVMFGNGLSGFACNVLRAITELIFPQDANNEEISKQNSFYSAVVFLTIGALTLLVCVAV